jgi:hypothetical protein
VGRKRKASRRGKKIKTGPSENDLGRKEKEKGGRKGGGPAGAVLGRGESWAAARKERRERREGGVWEGVIFNLFKL